MNRPLLIDAFPFHDELDLLEMRLVELYDTVDWFVLVEADVTHQDRPKPAWYLENRERFEPWADKIVPVLAKGMPTMAEDPDPWAREFAQREHIATGLAHIGADGRDIIAQSDVDEIPRALHLRNCLPRDRFVSFNQRGHFWAIDWEYPNPPGWFGTVAGTADMITRLGKRDPRGRQFGAMRSLRNQPGLVRLPNAGWHFSWLGGVERVNKKIGSFCHPEVEHQLRESIDDDMRNYRHGVHVDGEVMKPVNVDDSYPKWIVDGNAPDSWYRPRL